MRVPAAAPHRGSVATAGPRCAPRLPLPCTQGAISVLFLFFRCSLEDDQTKPSGASRKMVSKAHFQNGCDQAVSQIIILNSKFYFFLYPMQRKARATVNCNP